MTVVDRDLDSALSENLKLKSTAFETDTRVATYTVLVEQTQKRIKTLTERSIRSLRDLDGALAALDNEAKKVTAEFDIAKRDLEKARRDRDHRGADLQRLTDANTATASSLPDQQLEALEKELREAEAARKDAQTRMECAQSQWRVRLDGLRNEFEDTTSRNIADQQRRL